MSTTKNFYGASILALALLGAADIARAQDASAPEVEPADSGEIIVTARRQNESLQEVPQTVVPLTSEKLKDLQIRELEDIESLVPGLSLGGGSFASVQMRGVTFNNLTNGDSTIAFYYNDVDLDPSVALQGIYDVGQIEVLRGPQGTNRGVSAPSGSITLTTRRADLGEIGGYASGSLTTRDSYSVEAGFSVPIIKDILAIRFAGLIQQNDAGSIRSLNSTIDPYERVKSGRISIRFEPSSTFKANVMYQYIKNDAATFSQVFGTADPLFPTINPAILAQDRLAVSDSPSTNDAHFHILTGKIETSILGQNLTYVGGYQDSVSLNRPTNDPGNRLPGLDLYTSQFGTSTRMSHELRLSSEPGGDRFFDYTLGVYYRKSTQGGEATFSPALLPGAFESPLVPATVAAFNPRYFLETVAFIPLSYRELSAFGNVTLHLGPDTELTGGGLRYISSKFVGNSRIDIRPGFIASADPVPQLQLPAAVECGFVPGGLFGATYPGICDIPIAASTVSNVSVTIPDKALLYALSISHKVTPNFMVYATTGTSYLRPTATIGLQRDFGGSSNPLLRSLAFHPAQTSTGYEAGFKWTFPNNKGYLNVAGFYQKFKDFQITVPAALYRTATGSVTSFSFPTQVDATVHGFDAHLFVRATQNLSFNLLVSFSKGNATGNIPCNTGTAAAPNFNTEDVISFCSGGGQVSRNPEWNANLQVAYEAPINNSLEVFARGLVNYSPRNNRISPTYSVDSYALVNLFAGLRSPSRDWEVSVFAKNVFNDKTILTRGELPINSPSLASFPALNRASYTTVGLPPAREFGVTASFSFG